MKVDWYVPDYHDADAPKTTTVRAWCVDGGDAAKELAEVHWHRDGDYCQEFEIVIVAPEKWAGKYAVTIESEPVFYVRRFEDAKP